VVSSFLTFLDLPEYYDDKLLLRVAKEPSTAAGTDAFVSRQSAVTALQEEGLILKVVPLAARAVRRASYSAAVAGAGRGVIEADEESTELVTSIADVEPGSLAKVIRRLKGEHGVQAKRVPARYLCATPAAIPPAEKPLWNLERIRWQETRTLEDLKPAADITVAVLDTGIDADHPDLHGRIDSYEYSHPQYEVTEKDFYGHGTHVAGIVGALTNNAFGIHGVSDCRLKVWKIFTDEPHFIPARNMFCYLVDPVAYVQALEACLTASVDVLNLSIAGPVKPYEEEEEPIKKLIENGATVVAAMGNERMFGSPKSYPAAIEGVIAVGATNLNDEVTAFSSAGSHISLCAPGQAIWSTLPSYAGQTGFLPKNNKRPSKGTKPELGKPITRETDYDAWTGTSMAAPHVAGAIALFLAKHGKDSSNRVREAVERSADQVEAMTNYEATREKDSKNSDYGAGRLNLLKLLQ